LFPRTSRLREAEGRKPGMSKQGIEEESESDSSDDDDDDSDEDEGEKKKPAAKVKPSPAQLTIAAKKRAAAAGDEDKVEEKSAGKVDKNAGPEKLKAMDIKKMNGDALKDHLKERKLDLQGQKKDLIQRLLDFEAARS
jgi:SAP domain